MFSAYGEQPGVEPDDDSAWRPRSHTGLKTRYSLPISGSHAPSARNGRQVVLRRSPGKSSAFTEQGISDIDPSAGLAIHNARCRPARQRLGCRRHRVLPRLVDIVCKRCAFGRLPCPTRRDGQHRRAPTRPPDTRPGSSRQAHASHKFGRQSRIDDFFPALSSPRNCYNQAWRPGQ